MKIVHSFWSKPTLETGTYRTDDRKAGGWLEKRYSYMSWALSCLTFKKYYGDIELVTDSQGKSLLIDKLELPYDSILITLDALNGHNTDLWALAKLYAYQTQDKPFFHVDSDVFIWKRLTEIENESLVAQNPEIDLNIYKKIWSDILDQYDFIPSYMRDDFGANGRIAACNAGIFGGTDISFIKEFAGEAINFLDKNNKCYERINPLAGSVLIYEQYLFSCMARKCSRNVSYLFPFSNASYTELSDFNGVPRRKFYVHAVGTMKKNELVCQNMAAQLLLQFPEYYYRINELLRHNII